MSRLSASGPRRSFLRRLRGARAAALALAALATLAVGLPAAAQAVVLVSNFGHTGTAGDVNLAARNVVGIFTTGGSDATLNSIEFKLSQLVPNTVAPTVKLYAVTVAGRQATQGTEAATLITPSTSLTTSTFQTFTYTAPSGTILTASTKYIFVLEPPSAGLVVVQTTTDRSEDAGEAGWTIDGSSSGTSPYYIAAVAQIVVRVNGTLTTNDAPTAADKTVTTGVGTAYTFEADDFGFADTDGDTLASVKIVTVPAPGALALGSTAVLANAVVTKADIDGGMLTFTPAAGESGTGYATFTFKVNDGTDDSAVANTMTIDVTSAPDAPTGLTATASGASRIDLAWTAPGDTGGSAITGYRIEVSPDGASWADLVANTGSTATTYAHTGLNAATTRHYRVSAINDVGTSDHSGSDDATTTTTTAAMGAPTITGTAQVGQTLTAVTTGITDADGLTSPTYTYQWIRVDGTEADIAGANSSTYTLEAADLGKTIKVKVSFDDDVGNAETLTSAATATVIAPNTAPTAADNTVTTAQDTAYTFTATDFGFTDADTGAALASVKIVTVPTPGTLALDGTAVITDQVVTKAQIDGNMLTFTPEAGESGDPYTTFTFKVNDGTVDSAVANTMTIDVTAGNDPAMGAPTITGTAQVGQTLTAVTTGITDADGLTSPTYTYQWIRVDGTEADIAGANSSTYTLEAADLGKTIKVKVSFDDDVGNAETLTSAATATVIAPNTAPTAADNTVTTAQDTAYTFTATDFGFTDADTGAALASVKIVTVPTPGTLALDGTAVLVDAVVTKADIDDGDLTFTPVAGASGDNYASFTFKVNDGTDDSAGAYTMTIDVAEPPVVNPPARPATPTVSAVAGSTTSLSVSWAAPANAGKPAIVSYDVQYRVGSSGAWTDGPQDVTGTTTTVTGLVADTLYEARVRATNADGDSGWSDPPVSGRTNAPTNTAAAGAPAITGAAQVDRTLTATTTGIVDADGLTSSTYTYQWIRVNGTEADIAGANSSTYILVDADLGKTIKVRVTFDDDGGNTETLTSEATAPVQAADIDPPGPVSAEVPGTTLVRIGRTVGSQVVGALGQRLAGGQASHVTVAGVPLTGGAAPVPEDEADDAFGLSEWAKSARREEEARTITADDLRLRSAFHASSRGRDAQGPAITTWGRVSAGGFDAEVDDVTIDGDVTTGLLGFDAEWDDLLAGMMLSQSEGEGAYRLDPAQGSDAGTVKSDLTGVYPYARINLNARVSAWALAGAGSGSLTLKRGGRGAMKTDLSMRMGALGVQGQVLDGTGPSDMRLDFKSDAMWVGTKSARSADMAGSEGDVTRLRLVAQGERHFVLAGQGRLTPSAELGLRHDDGDAETGVGVELGAGLRYIIGSFSIEARARTLVAHETSGYEEWGASAAVGVTPRASGRGLSLSIAPTWGRTGSASEWPWSARDVGEFEGGGGFEADGRIEAQMGYGFALPRNRGLLTPYSALTLGSEGGRTMRGGARWMLDSDVAVTLDATRTESAGTEAENEVRVQAALRF